MIKLIEVKLSYGAQAVLDKVSWMLGERDRAGLVGGNGSGKSTLLKVMAGLQGVDSGVVERSGGLEAGYLPQEEVTHAGRTLDQEVRSAMAPLLDIEAERRRIERMLRGQELEPKQQEELVNRMCELEERFRIKGGYELEPEMARILAGLGFSREDRRRPVESFSGGWQMRIALAKLLLKKPRALLLDEPTNHLDIEARNWLEDYLADYPHSCLVVSHDRYFLDVTVDRIVEIEDGKLYDYKGNYSHYLEAKEKRTALAEAAYYKQQEEVERLKAFIGKYKADKKRAGQVQSRIKRLEKMELIEPPRPRRAVRFSFPKPPRGPLELVKLQAVKKAYGENLVLDGVDFTVTRGETVAVVGKNGAGKSTLMRILAGMTAPDAGERIEKPGAQIAYFGQEAGFDLNPQATVLEDISEAAALDMQPRLRTLLGAFLFSGGDVDKKVKVLSGGEKSRLALAKLLLKPANLLLMDEPTNHLDLRAKEVLFDAFKNYTGALVFVAHDRYFMDRLPDRVVEVKDGKTRSFPGDYEDYLRALAREEDKKKKGHKNKTAGQKGEKKKKDRIKKGQERKNESKERKRLEKRAASLEKQIAGMEQAMGSIEQKMSDPRVAKDYVKLMELEREKTGMKQELDELYREWEGLAARLGEEG